MKKTVSELFEEFETISNPEECGCEYQHFDSCLTMKWVKKLEEVREAIKELENKEHSYSGYYTRLSNE